LVSQINDASATDKHKSVISRNSNATGTVNMSAVRWANTAAVTSITISCSSNIAAGSTLALFGVAA